MIVKRKQGNHRIDFNENKKKNNEMMDKQIKKLMIKRRKIKRKEQVCPIMKQIMIIKKLKRKSREIKK